MQQCDVFFFHRHSCLATSQLSSSCHPWDESHRCMGILHKEVVSPCQFCLNPVWLRVSKTGHQKQDEHKIYSLTAWWWQCVCFVFVMNIHHKSARSDKSENLKKTHLHFLHSSIAFHFLLVHVCLCYIVVYHIVSRVHRYHQILPSECVKWAYKHFMSQKCCLNLWNPKCPGAFFF